MSDKTVHRLVGELMEEHPLWGEAGCDARAGEQAEVWVLG